MLTVLLYGRLRMSFLEIIVCVGLVGLFVLIEKVKEKEKARKKRPGNMP